MGQMLEASLPPGSIVMVVRNRLRREVYPEPGTVVMSGSGCYHGLCTHLWSYSSQDLRWYPCCHQVLCWLRSPGLPPGHSSGPWVTLPLEPYWSVWPLLPGAMVTARPRLFVRTISVPIVLLQLKFMLLSMSPLCHQRPPVAWGVSYILWPCWCPGTMWTILIWVPGATTWNIGCWSG